MRSELNIWRETLVELVRTSPADLTNRQMALLLIVYLDEGPHTVRGLATGLRVSKPVVTRILNALGALDYVRRAADPSDLRSLFVERTVAGRAFLDGFGRLIQGRFMQETS